MVETYAVEETEEGELHEESRDQANQFEAVDDERKATLDLGEELGVEEKKRDEVEGEEDSIEEQLEKALREGIPSSEDLEQKLDELMQSTRDESEAEDTTLPQNEERSVSVVVVHEKKENQINEEEKRDRIALETLKKEILRDSRNQPDALVLPEEQDSTFSAASDHEELRRQLYAMEYVDYLGKDSTQLAKKLLGDIILTTESHEELFQEVQALKTALAFKDKVLVPLKEENERVVRENNELRSRAESLTLDQSENRLTLEGKYKKLNDAFKYEKYKSEQLKRRNDHLQQALEEANTRKVGRRNAVSQRVKARNKTQAVPKVDQNQMESEHIQSKNLARSEEGQNGILVESCSTCKKLAHKYGLRVSDETELEQLSRKVKLYQEQIGLQQAEVGRVKKLSEHFLSRVIDFIKPFSENNTLSGQRCSTNAKWKEVLMRLGETLSSIQSAFCDAEQQNITTQIELHVKMEEAQRALSSTLIEKEKTIEHLKQQLEDVSDHMYAVGKSGQGEEPSMIEKALQTTSSVCEDCEILKNQNLKFIDKITELSTKILSMDKRFEHLLDTDMKIARFNQEISEKDRCISDLRAELASLKEFIPHGNSYPGPDGRGLEGEEQLMLQVHNLELSNKDLLLQVQTLREEKADVRTQASKLEESIVALRRKAHIKDDVQPLKLDGANHSTYSKPDLLNRIQDLEQVVKMKEEIIDRLQRDRTEKHLETEEYASKFVEVSNSLAALQSRQDRMNPTGAMFQRAQQTDQEATFSSELREEFACLRAENTTLSQDFLEAQKRIRSLQSRVGKLDDVLHDNETLRKRLALLADVSNAKNKALEELKATMQKLNHSLSDQEEVVAKRDIEIKRFQLRLDAKEDELERLRRKLLTYEKNFEAAKNDLKVMIQDNQQFHQTNQLLRTELGNGRQQVKTCLVQKKQVENTIQKIKADKRDLLNAYRKACEEVQRLKLIVEKYNHKITMYNMTTSDKSEEIRELQEIISKFEDKVRTQMIELKSYQRQVTALTDEIRQNAQKMNTLESSSRQVERVKQNADVTVKRLINKERNLKIELADLEAELDRQKNKLKLGDNENKIINNLLQKERKRCTKLEEIITRLRKGDVQNKVLIKNQDVQIQQLAHIAEAEQTSAPKIGPNKVKTRGGRKIQSPNHGRDFVKAMSDVTNVRSNNKLLHRESSEKEAGKENTASFKASEAEGRSFINLSRDSYSSNTISLKPDSKLSLTRDSNRSVRPTTSTDSSSNTHQHSDPLLSDDTSVSGGRGGTSSEHRENRYLHHLDFLDQNELEKQCKELEEMISQQSQLLKTMETG